MPDYAPPPGHTRYRLEAQWDGAGFVGWQSQPGGRSVQDSLLAAFAPLGEARRPVAAGRTDAGVHAERMPLHIDVAGLKLPPERLARALNAQLPPDLAVLEARLAPVGFHARHSCLERAYVYRVLTTPQRRPLWQDRALHRPGALDLGAMRAAAAQVIGDHDFAAFATREERDTRRRLHRVEVAEAGELLEVRVAGLSFLRHMVRGLVGTLLQVGAGQLGPDAVADILASRERAQAGPNLPPHGLYFVGAVYGE